MFLKNLQHKSGMSVAPSTVARFNHNLDYLDIGTFQIPLPSIAVLSWLTQLNSAVSTTTGQSIQLLIHREIRREKTKPYSLGSVGRPVRVANTPLQIPRDKDWQYFNLQLINTFHIYYL